MQREIAPVSGVEETIVGIGFAIPYMPEGGFALMPGGQGAIRWPANENRTAVVDESHLPIHDNSLDKVIVIHALEYCVDVRGFLREIWRVLKPEGRAAFIAPNRMRPWAGVSLGGQRFFKGELSLLLADNMFVVEKSSGGFGRAVIIEARKRIYAGSGGSGLQKALATVPVTG